MANDLHHYAHLGDVVPDYALDRFIAFTPAPPPSAPPPRRIINLPPPPSSIAIDVLVADTLEKHLRGLKVRDLLTAVTRGAMLFAMRRTHGNQLRAAAILGLGRYTFGKWCAKHAIDRRRFGGRTYDGEDAD